MKKSFKSKCQNNSKNMVKLLQNEPKQQPKTCDHTHVKQPAISQEKVQGKHKKKTYKTWKKVSIRNH